MFYNIIYEDKLFLMNILNNIDHIIYSKEGADMKDIKFIRDAIQSSTTDPDGYRNHAILIPIVEINGELCLLYEKRSISMKTQPGEVCFPGGKIEYQENPMEAAIRETCEELGICSSHIEIIGEINKIVTPFNIMISCFVGYVRDYENLKLNINADEVAEVFTIPLSHILNNEAEEYIIKSKLIIPEDFPYHMIQNGNGYNWKSGEYPIVFYTYEDKVVWGITARITRNFAHSLKYI